MPVTNRPSRSASAATACLSRIRALARLQRDAGQIDGRRHASTVCDSDHRHVGLAILGWLQRPSPARHACAVRGAAQRLRASVPTRASMRSSALGGLDGRAPALRTPPLPGPDRARPAHATTRETTRDVGAGAPRWATTFWAECPRPQTSAGAAAATLMALKAPPPHRCRQGSATGRRRPFRAAVSALAAAVQTPLASSLILGEFALARTRPASSTSLDTLAAETLNALMMRPGAPSEVRIQVCGKALTQVSFSSSEPTRPPTKTGAAIGARTALRHRACAARRRRR